MPTLRTGFGTGSERLPITLSKAMPMPGPPAQHRWWKASKLHLNLSSMGAATVADHRPARIHSSSLHSPNIALPRQKPASRSKQCSRYRPVSQRQVILSAAWTDNNPRKHSARYRYMVSPVVNCLSTPPPVLRRARRRRTTTSCATWAFLARSGRNLHSLPLGPTYGSLTGSSFTGSSVRDWAPNIRRPSSGSGRTPSYTF